MPLTRDKITEALDIGVIAYIEFVEYVEVHHHDLEEIFNCFDQPVKILEQEDCYLIPCCDPDHIPPSGIMLY